MAQGTGGFGYGRVLKWIAAVIVGSNVALLATAALGAYAKVPAVLAAFGGLIVFVVLLVAFGLMIAPTAVGVDRARNRVALRERKRLVPWWAWLTICGLFGGGLAVLAYTDPAEADWARQPKGIGSVVAVYGSLPFVVFGLIPRSRDMLARRTLRRTDDTPKPVASTPEARKAGRQVRGPNQLNTVRDRIAGLGGGVYLGANPTDGGWVVTDRQHAVLVLGPPRSGKTSSVIIPSILAAAGPVVSTSTKPEVMTATGQQRARIGSVWHFDPSGSDPTPEWATRLAWSPVPSSTDWDQALLMSRAMIAAAPSTGQDVTDGSHWTERGTALLAPLLHAAAINHQPISIVLGWVLSHNLTQPQHILDTNPEASALAAGSLTSIAETHERELSSIFSTVSNVLAAYNSHAAQTLADHPNFEAAEFVNPTTAPQTIYITAPAHHQDMIAPIVVALIQEIRNAAYLAHRQQTASSPAPNLLFALDEAANIAPIPGLPAMVSEGGGQGVTVLAVFQDLSQVRRRWKAAGDGFLSLFATKLIFGGIGDQQTLQALSTITGDWDRPTQTTSRNQQFMQLASTSTSWTTSRQPLLTPSEIANIPKGHELAIQPSGWELLELTPHYKTSPWAKLTNA